MYLVCGIVPAMNNFKDGGFKRKGKGFGGKPKFGGDTRGGNRPGGNKHAGGKPGGRPAEMFKAECSQCHKACTLPFRPSSDKPVFCSDCFAKKQADGERGADRRHDNRSGHSKPPRSERPERHDRPQSPSSDQLAGIQRQLSTIEARLNRILDVMNPPLPPKKTSVPEVVAVVVEKEVVVKKSVASKVIPKVAKKAVSKKGVATKKAATKKAAPAKKIAKKVTKAKKK